MFRLDCIRLGWIGQVSMSKLSEVITKGHRAILYSVRLCGHGEDFYKSEKTFSRMRCTIECVTTHVRRL